MNQIIHILRKDLRRFWPEILISLAFLAAFVWHEPNRWARINPTFTFLSQALSLLLPLSWMLLLVRAIHDEPLVGHRQFWVTRPYDWRQMLAAKVLLVLLAVNVPLLIAQVLLLKRAGFPPGHYLGGLLEMQLLLLVRRFLPVATLAVLTRNLAQAGLALLAILLSGFVMLQVAISGSLDRPFHMAYGPSIWDGLSTAVILFAPCAVIVWQYARRKIAWSLLFLAGGVIVSLACNAAIDQRALIDRRFPAAGVPVPVQVALGQEKPAQKEEGGKEKWVPLQLPVLASGLSGEWVARVTGARLYVEAPGEKEWDAGWQGEWQMLLLPGENSSLMRIAVRRDFFDRVKSTPVKIRLALAIEFYRDANAMEISVPWDEFALPRVGWCSIDQGAYFNAGGINCRVPLRWPSAILVKSEAGASTCKGNENRPPLPQDEMVVDWRESRDSVPAISPVQTLGLALMARQRGKTFGQSVPVCPGTPLTFSFPELTHRGRVEMEAGGIKLEEYRLPVTSGVESLGFSIGW